MERTLSQSEIFRNLEKCRNLECKIWPSMECARFEPAWKVTRCTNWACMEGAFMRVDLGKRGFGICMWFAVMSKAGMEHAGSKSCLFVLVDLQCISGNVDLFLCPYNYPLFYKRNTLPMISFFFFCEAEALLNLQGFAKYSYKLSTSYISQKCPWQDIDFFNSN